VKLPAVVTKGTLPALALLTGLGWWPVSLVHALMAHPVARGFAAGVLASAAVVALVLMHKGET
jgi:hypothetical protein